MKVDENYLFKLSDSQALQAFPLSTSKVGAYLSAADSVMAGSVTPESETPESCTPESMPDSRVPESFWSTGNLVVSSLLIT